MPRPRLSHKKRKSSKKKRNSKHNKYRKHRITNSITKRFRETKQQSLF